MRTSVLVPFACASLHALLVAAHLSLLAIWAYGAEHAIVFAPQIASSVQTYTSLVAQIIIVVSWSLSASVANLNDTARALHSLACLLDAIRDATLSPLGEEHAHVSARRRKCMDGSWLGGADPMETDEISLLCGRADSSDALPHLHFLPAYNDTVTLLCAIIPVLGVQRRGGHVGNADFQCIVGRCSALWYNAQG